MFWLLTHGTHTHKASGTKHSITCWWDIRQRFTVLALHWRAVQLYSFIGMWSTVYIKVALRGTLYKVQLMFFFLVCVFRNECMCNTNIHYVPGWWFHFIILKFACSMIFYLLSLHLFSTLFSFQSDWSTHKRQKDSEKYRGYNHRYVFNLYFSRYVAWKPMHLW